MTEDEAKRWLTDRFGREAFGMLQTYVDLLIAANREQNLISRSSEDSIWVRHILDSAQLASFAPQAKTWLDIGSGAGLPGIVLAIITAKPITLVEPRRMRVAFLEDVATTLGLGNCRIVQKDVEKLPAATFGAITARAVSRLSALFTSAYSHAGPSTIWVLPKGRKHADEVAEAHEMWQGSFHVEQSLSDPEARIVVASSIQPR